MKQAHAMQFKRPNPLTGAIRGSGDLHDRTVLGFATLKRNNLFATTSGKSLNLQVPAATVRHRKAEPTVRMYHYCSGYGCFAAVRYLLT